MRSVLVLSLTWVVPACVTDGAARREVISLRRQVDQMRHKSVRDQRTIDDLQNRLFVLEDRLETAQLQVDKTDRLPRLPVVTKHVEPPAAAPPAPAESSTAAPTSTPAPEEVEVVYEGEALMSSGQRPRIALNESGRQDDWVRVDEPPPAKPRRTRPILAAESRYPDPRAVTDRIPMAAVPAAPSKEPDEHPIAVYKDGQTALQRHQHASAVAAFQRFLERWPAHDYADNAQYWLGEAHYDHRDYKVALLEFRKVVQKYPAGNKAPDALLKVGYCYANLGDAGSAKDVLSQVVDIYPKTDAARLAVKRLEELR
jgi:tol-pal system protein YbgF